jgi:hypothetical protein
VSYFNLNALQRFLITSAEEESITEYNKWEEEKVNQKIVESFYTLTKLTSDIELISDLLEKNKLFKGTEFKN